MSVASLCVLIMSVRIAVTIAVGRCWTSKRISNQAVLDSLNWDCMRLVGPLRRPVCFVRIGLFDTGGDPVMLKEHFGGVATSDKPGRQPYDDPYLQWSR